MTDTRAALQARAAALFRELVAQGTGTPWPRTEPGSRRNGRKPHD
jgi:hypothetical protein